MAVTTVLVHYSDVNSNGIKQERFPIREERNVNDVISMTDN